LTASLGAADHASMLRIARPVGVLLVALLCAAVLFLSLPGTTYWQRVLQDGGHGPVFAAVAIVLLLMRAGAGPAANGTRTWSDYRWAFAIAFALGVVTELLQGYLPNRTPSLLDALHDAAGAALGLALVAWLEAPRAPLARSWSLAVALAAVVVLGWAPLQCARAYAERSAAFPTLGPMGPQADLAFAAAREGVLTTTRLPEAWRRPGDGAQAWRLDAQPGQRPALELAEPAPDWRGYTVLALDLANPGRRAARFTLRILDAHHDWTHADRLNLPVVVPPGSRTTVRVATAAIASAPRGRPMDMAAIANVMLFANEPLPGEAIYVSRIWLEE
jgi:hypothetical protein